LYYYYHFFKNQFLAQLAELVV